MSRCVTNLFIVLSVVVFTLSVLPVLASSPAVHIPDANLRAAINAALGEGRAADAVVTRSELASLTTLSFQVGGLAIGEQVTDLTGLEYATSLTRLELGFNAITDLSPLATLTALTYLARERDAHAPDYTNNDLRYRFSIQAIGCPCPALLYHTAQHSDA